MKKTFTLFVLSLIGFSSVAQQVNSESYDELMKKSRRARTMSTIFVATGPVIAAGGIGTLIYGLIQNEMAETESIYDNNGNYLGETSPKKYNSEIAIGAVGAVVGLGVALTSIVFSNRAYEFKRQARKMKLKTSLDRFKIPGLQNNFANTRVTQYKLSLMIPLGR